MSIKKRSDLFREYARVIDMCEGTGVDPYECVGCGMSLCDDEPTFMSDPGNYTFAVAIVGGKPMFVGDVVISDGMQLTFTSKTKIDVNPDPRTWNKPKRTLTLAGMELPMPIIAPEMVPCCGVGNMRYYFNSNKDKEEFSEVLNAIIHKAMQKCATTK